MSATMALMITMAMMEIMRTMAMTGMTAIMAMTMSNNLARMSVDQQATGASCPGKLVTATELLAPAQHWRT